MDALIALLQKRGLDLDDEDLADILWLATYQDAPPSQQQDEKTQANRQIKGQVSEQPNLDKKSSSGENSVNRENDEGDGERDDIDVTLPQTQPHQASSGAANTTLPIQVPAAPPLRHRLELERALRPLKRKADSRIAVVLNEKATANQIAESRRARSRRWMPIFQPAKERWFEVALVIEESASTILWQELLTDFQRLMERQGAFRNVRTWSLALTDRGDPQLYVRRGNTTQWQRPRSPKELCDVSGRRIILVISDCVSVGWYRKPVYELLAEWSKEGPLALLQLLPSMFWNDTGLGAASVTVALRSLCQGGRNRRLIPEGLMPWESEGFKRALPLPVMTLQPSALGDWAKVMAGNGGVRTKGLLVDPTLLAEAESLALSEPPPLQSRDLVNLFWSTASETAKELAGLLAAVPISMPIVHLLQQTLLPRSSQVHVAEVFMSGLVQRMSTPLPGHGSESIQFDFINDEVRRLLFNTVSISDSEAVLDAVSDYAARKLGLSLRGFDAVLSYLAREDGSSSVAELMPFARIAKQSLRRMGGDYAAWVDAIESEEFRRKPKPDEDWEIPQLETLLFDTAQLIESLPDRPWPPLLQTEQYTVATIALATSSSTDRRITLEPFSFKVGYLVNLGSGWVIQKSDAQARRYIEQIDERTILEMVEIPEGAFSMGSPKDEKEGFKYEKPQHSVTVPGFYMGRYPVTQAQWRSVAALPQVERSLDPDPSHFKGATRPVDMLSWEDAIEFCARLNKLTKRRYRLPTEAEWEYACRAGTITPFHFGETISPELANYNGGNAYGDGPMGERRVETTPVEHFDVANAWGLCDMHGNVLEWCQDHWNENYTGAPIDGGAWILSSGNAVDSGASPSYDPEGNITSRRVLRGGSWGYNPGNCRSARRFHDVPSYRTYHISFRVSCSVLESS
jgi:formylglycine-generating enzyme required for sulfatase activity